MKGDPGAELPLTPARKADLKSRIEQVLSEILSDKYECKVTLHFEKGGTDECTEHGESSGRCPQPLGLCS